MTKAATFTIPGGVGFCNAVRRTLLSDVEAWAPCEVVIRTNTSCQTDEFIAHRCGLIPFRRCGNGEELVLHVHGPATACARDFTGPGFEAVEGGVAVMVLDAGQTLDMTVRFDRRPASVHARYAMCAAVGMECTAVGTSGKDSSGKDCVLRFETINGSEPRDVLLEALDALDARVQRALLNLAHQPSEPPPSMC